MSHLHTTRFSRGKLPHWEVHDGQYFVTVRCADSLPREAVERLREVSMTLRSTESNSDEFAALQRFYFHALEKYLDAGSGECPLQHARAAELVVAELDALGEWEVEVPHYVVMPNHWHAMVVPRDSCTRLADVMQRVKGRSARAINLALGRAGALWQREWFDRWMRSEDEYDRCVRYIQDNPSKTGIVAHSWVK